MNLPAELLVQVFRYISRADLDNILYVNKHLNLVATAIKWNQLILEQGKSAKRRDLTNLVQLAKTRGQRNVLKHVRYLYFAIYPEDMASLCEIPVCDLMLLNELMYNVYFCDLRCFCFNNTVEQLARCMPGHHIYLKMNDKKAPDTRSAQVVVRHIRTRLKVLTLNLASLAVVDSAMKKLPTTLEEYNMNMNESTIETIDGKFFQVQMSDMEDLRQMKLACRELTNKSHITWCPSSLTDFQFAGALKDPMTLPNVKRAKFLLRSGPSCYVTMPMVETLDYKVEDEPLGPITRTEQFSAEFCPNLRTLQCNMHNKLLEAMLPATNPLVETLVIKTMTLSARQMHNLSLAMKLIALKSYTIEGIMLFQCGLYERVQVLRVFLANNPHLKEYKMRGNQKVESGCWERVGSELVLDIPKFLQKYEKYEK